MPYAETPDDSERDDNERCTHPRRIVFALDHPAIQKILVQHAELFTGLTPAHAYVCPDCAHLWLVFPL